MFPDNLYISDAAGGSLYTIENDVVSGTISINPDGSDVKQGQAILVSQNMIDVYTVNRSDGTITRIRNGQVIGDIKVGNMPYGICEDRNGRIYVTNHSDNTVSVIENGVVVGHPISVPGGPKGIVADYFGNIWVACYLTNTVAKIVNKIVVDEIPVAYNPDGITCSPTNHIWVACSGSNVVVKISDGKKALTIPTGKCPVAVVTDKKGHVFTANFEDDTVTMISTSEDNQQTTIAVGDGPNAIDINSQGHVYVTSSLSSELVYKINPSTAQVVDTIHVCKSQAAFGDFTGCATFNVFNPNGTGDGSISSGALDNVIQALRPTFKISDIDESAKIKFTLDSDLLNLSKFDRLLLNGKPANENGEFELTVDEAGTSLQLTGYFANDDDNPIVFVPVPFVSAFKAYIGVTDNDYQNCVILKEKTIDFSNQTVSTSFIEQPKQGHLILFIPRRSFTAFKDGFMVQGSHDIGNTWSETIPDSSVSAEPQVIEWDVTDKTDLSEENRMWDVEEITDQDTVTVTSGNAVLIKGTDYTIRTPSSIAGTGYSDIIVNDFSKLGVDNKIIITIQRAGTTTTTSGTVLLNNIYNNDLNWDNNKVSKYQVLVNTYQTNINEKWMFSFFNTLG